jgi:hypothetical protein
MNRFTELKSSKFERLSQAELNCIKGSGVCISCMKRDRKVKIVVSGETIFYPNKIE